jgi:hypothetical protein
MKNKNVAMLVFGIIFWPISIATPQVFNAYILNGDIIKFLVLGSISGLFGAGILIALSYFIAFITSLIIKKTSINGPSVFFVITCLGVVLWLSYLAKIAL